MTMEFKITQPPSGASYQITKSGPLRQTPDDERLWHVERVGDPPDTQHKAFVHRQDAEEFISSGRAEEWHAQLDALPTPEGDGQGGDRA